MNMNICMIYQDNYPWDVRVEKIAKVLVQAGHGVHIACRNTRRDKNDERIDGFFVHRLRVPRPGNDKIGNGLSMPFFFNPLWILHVARIVREYRIDALVVRDLPLTLTAQFVGKLLGIPVIFDMAENYPAALADWRSWEHGLKRVKNSIVRNVWAANRVEGITLKYIDHVIVVAEESKERLVAKGVPADRISIVGNTPDLSIFSEDRPPDDVLTERFADKFVILYIGEIHMHRGLDVAIKAMPEIVGAIPNACLLIIGKGLGQAEIEMKQFADDLRVGDHVLFEGWVNLHKLPDYIRASTIGIVPHYKSEHVNTTLPNKLFDYMTFGKPVVVSDARPLKRVVEQERCGIAFASGSSKSLAEGVIRLKDDEVRKALGLSGKNAVRKKYNWNIDSSVLRRIFENLSDGTRKDMMLSPKPIHP